MFFFHINKQISAQEIAILQGILRHVVGLYQFFRFLHPFTDSHRYVKSHNFFGLILNFPTDFSCLFGEVAAPFFLKQNSDTIVTFLICKSCFFTCHDLITDIVENKCHECTFLLFFGIQFIHS